MPSSRLTEGVLRRLTEGGAGSGSDDRFIIGPSRRGGAPRGRAPLRHWGAGTPSQGVPACPFPPRKREGDKHATGAAFRTSALAALHSLTGEIVARIQS